jgi:DeoR/GlpR family transcriptional regulator of sugar metabolism
MQKPQESAIKRQERIVNRIVNAKNVGREIQRLADELCLSERTIYRDLENSEIEKKNGFRY